MRVQFLRVCEVCPLSSARRGLAGETAPVDLIPALLRRHPQEVQQQVALRTKPPSIRLTTLCAELCPVVPFRLSNVAELRTLAVVDLEPGEVVQQMVACPTCQSANGFSLSTLSQAMPFALLVAVEHVRGCIRFVDHRVTLSKPFYLNGFIAISAAYTCQPKRDVMRNLFRPGLTQKRFHWRGLDTKHPVGQEWNRLAFEAYKVAELELL